MLVFQQHERWLCDREALAVWLQRSPETIRKRCPVAEYHADGRALYDMEVCEVVLGGLQRRDRGWQRGP